MNFIKKAMFDDPISHVPLAVVEGGDEAPPTPKKKVPVKQPLSKQPAEKPDYNEDG